MIWWQMHDMETVEPQKIPIKVCATFYNIEIYDRGCREKKKVFLQSFNMPKCMVVGLLTVEGLFCFVI